MTRYERWEDLRNQYSEEKEKGTNVKLESWHYQTRVSSLNVYLSVGPATEAKKRSEGRKRRRVKTWYALDVYGTRGRDEKKGERMRESKREPCESRSQAWFT